MITKHGGDIWEASSRSGRGAGELIDFSSSINPAGLAPGAREAVIGLIKDKDLGTAYPDPRSLNLLQTLSGYLGVEEKNILAANGSTELIYLIPQILRPERALIIEPAFSEYALPLLSTGTEVIPFLLSEEDGFSLNLEKLKKALKEVRPNILYIANPSNPVGRLTKKNTLLRIAEVCKDEDIWLVVDEAFIDFNESASIAREAAAQNHIIVLRSMTKFFALAALRLGYMTASKALIDKFRSALVTWSVNTAAAVAGAASLGDSAYIEETRRWLKRENPLMRKALLSIEGLKVYDSAANFFTLRITKKAGAINAPRLKKLLLNRGILIRDLSNIRGLGESFFRIAIKTPEQNRLILSELEDILEGAETDLKSQRGA